MKHDGTTGVVRIAPEAGEKLRGVAAGLRGNPGPESQLDRPELLAARRKGDAAVIHSWELVTAVDGPGTRLTLFLSGCPLRCLYCHNPDTMGLKDGTLETLEDTVRRVVRYKSVFRATGGGLTLSGGEPLFQIAFVRRLLQMVHAEAIHTTIDTSGFLGARLLDEDLDNIDLVLLDIKAGEPALYEKVTGRALEPTLAFGDRLHRLDKKVWIRFVHVPGLTDAPDNVRKVAEIAARWASTVQRVEVLPFHNMGADKWSKIGLDYTLADTPAPNVEEVERSRQIFREFGFETF